MFQRILTILILIGICFAGVEQIPERLQEPSRYEINAYAVSITEELYVYDRPVEWRGFPKAKPYYGEVIEVLPYDYEIFVIEQSERGLGGDYWVYIQYGEEEVFYEWYDFDGHEWVYNSEILVIPLFGWVLEHVKYEEHDRWYIEYLYRELNYYNGYELDLFGLIGIQLLYAQSPEEFKELSQVEYVYPWWRGLVAFLIAIGISFIMFSKWTCSWFPMIKSLQGKYKFWIWVGLMILILGCVLGVSFAEIAILVRGGKI